LPGSSVPNIDIARAGTGPKTTAPQSPQRRIVDRNIGLKLIEGGGGSGVVGEMRYRGQPISDKIKMGTALVVNNKINISEFPKIDLKIEAEAQDKDVDELVNATINATNEAFDEAIAKLAKSKNQIISGQKDLLIEIRREIINIIRNKKVNASWAIQEVLELFSGNKDSSDQKAKGDYYDLYAFLATILAIKHGKMINIKEEIDRSGLQNVILVVHNIPITEDWIIDDRRIIGVIKEKGTFMDHFSICMRDHEKSGIIVEGIAGKIETGQTVIIKGRTREGSGEVIVNPFADTRQKYNEYVRRHHVVSRKLKKLRHMKPRFIKGHVVEMAGNIRSPDEIESLRKHGIRKIGLVRTEFFFIEKPDKSKREEAPSVDEQVEFYNRIAASAGDGNVIFRTIDPDIDKQFPYFKDLVIGQKGLGLCLTNKQYYFAFKDQLKALLQVRGKIKVMFPLVRSQEEFEAAMRIVEEVKNELRGEGKTVNKNIKFGIMVEHPDILPFLPFLIKHKLLSFLSLGTNDLTQYISLLDRYDQEAAKDFDELSPSIIQAIKSTINIAIDEEKEVSLCGDMFRNWRAMLVVLGYGLRHFSISTDKSDLARKIILSVYFEDLQELVKEIEKIKTSRGIKKFIEDFTREKINSGRWAGLKSIREKLFESEDKGLDV